MSRPPSAARRRAAHPDFSATFSYQAIAAKLPLVIQTLPATPYSNKRAWRSHYVYQGHVALADSNQRARLSDLEVALQLVDFTSLRNELAQRLYAPSARGRPFDPVSLFLCLLLRRELNLSWARLAKTLAGPSGAEWRCQFGFGDGRTPSASGLRYFANTLGPDYVEDLLSRFVACLMAAGLVPQASTFPGDRLEHGVAIARDGQLHTARAKPPECTCRAATCRSDCPRTQSRDAEARFITYSGRNKREPKAGQLVKGKTVFGYRSIADRLLDDRFHVGWTVRVMTYPANTDERSVFAEEFETLQRLLGPVAIGEFVADAAYGVDPILSFLYRQGILRLIDTRATEGDDDSVKQRQRGYDAKGRPLCLHGWPMTANGFDPRRRRAKYICAHACRRQDDACVPDCPFLAPTCKHGQVVNVGRCLPDGSTRLARDLLVGSAAWKARYGRRNLTESRNSAMERAGLKRLPVHGLKHARLEIAAADLLENLRTLGRLVAEATHLMT